MKTRNCYLILALATAICSVSALAQLEYHPPAEKRKPISPDPGLVGIKLITVTVVPPDRVPEKGFLDPEGLKAQVEDRVKKAGLNIFTPEEGVRYDLGEISQLKVQLEAFKLADSGEYVCRLQTFLSRAVNLAHKYDRSGTFIADVWKTEPATVAASLADMSGQLAKVVLHQVDTFIATCIAANPPGEQAVPADGAARAEQPKGESAAKAPALGQMYVASKNANAFHKPDCRWAKNISPGNLVGYGSRDEAIAAGKKPCKSCKP
jgi:hypothetical protein